MSETIITTHVNLTDERRKKIGWLLGYYPGEDGSADLVECQDWLNSFIQESIDGIEIPD